MSTALNGAARPHSRLDRSGVSRPDDPVESWPTDDATPQRGLLSVTELQQALREIRARRPGAGHSGWRPDRADVLNGSSPRADAVVRDHLAADWVTVLAAHAGAGASTVALALSDAAADADRRVHLVEAAHPSRCGLVAASYAELGIDATGAWRRGARSQVTIDRRADDGETRRWPVLPPGEAPAVTVVDLGLLDEAELCRLIGADSRTVLVCRATLPGVRLTEQVLERLNAAMVLVAAVGPRRWPGEVTASLGPRLRALRAAGRVVAVPVDARLEITGLTPAPLPKPVLAAGRALLALLEADRMRADDPVPCAPDAKESRR